jgi:hypothetical protein
MHTATNQWLKKDERAGGALPGVNHKPLAPGVGVCGEGSSTVQTYVSRLPNVGTACGA